MDEVLGVWICKYLQIVLHQKHFTDIKVWLFLSHCELMSFEAANQMQKLLSLEISLWKVCKIKTY